MRSIPFRFVPSLSLALFATSAACAMHRGKADPVASDASAEGRHQNRRVEIVVEGMGQDAGTR